jgi:hypothetical protein
VEGDERAVGTEEGWFGLWDGSGVSWKEDRLVVC